MVLDRGHHFSAWPCRGCASYLHGTALNHHDRPFFRYRRGAGADNLGLATVHHGWARYPYGAPRSAIVSLDTPSSC